MFKKPCMRQGISERAEKKKLLLCRTAAIVRLHNTVTKSMQDTQTPLRWFLQLNFSFTSNKYFNWQLFNCLTFQAFPVTSKKKRPSLISYRWPSIAPRERFCQTLKHLHLKNLSYMIVRVSLILSFTHHNTEKQLCSTAAVQRGEPQLSTPSVQEPGMGSQQGQA